MQDGLIGPLDIRSLAFGGRGVARSEGRVIFVRGAVPGDLVRARLTREKKRFAEAEAVHFDHLSPQRCEPVCEVFGECGGCQWQMLSYAAQLEHKENIFRDIWRRQCGIEDSRITPILESPVEWHYRSRIQCKCQINSDGHLEIGFFHPGSHAVVDVSSCPIAAPAFNHLLTEVRSILQGSDFAAQITQFDMETGDTEHIRLVVHYRGRDVVGLAETLAPLSDSALLSLYIRSGAEPSLCHVSGPEELTFEVDAPALTLSYGAGGFSQINLVQNRRMLAEAIRMTSPQKDWRVLDLFCGMGNFSLPFARRVKNVVAVEDFAGSIAQGRLNAAQNRITNVEFITQSAQGICAALSKAEEFDLVILDPPRSGAKEVAAELAQQRIKRILYVSCDPMTLTRDLNLLLESGYRLIESKPVDMFPQTYHLESLTYLERE